MNIRFYGISVCVFCGSACGKDSAYAREMYKLGKHISNNNWNLIYGGGNLGLMGEIARGFDKSKSKLVSIVPRSLDKENILYSKPSKKILVKDLFERKRQMINLSDYIIVSPGGIGTLDEMLDILALNNLGIQNKKVVVLNLNNYWEPFQKLLLHIQKNNFLNDNEKCNLYFFDTVNKTIKFIKNNL